MGDAIDSIMASKYLQLQVTDTVELSPYVKKVSFTGDLRDTSCQIGHAVSFRVSATEYRNYTPSYFSPAENECEIIFHLHGNGPGSEYAAGLSTGDMVKMVTPRGRTFYRDHPYHFFFGDETTLGLYKAIQREITQREQLYTGILELDPANVFLPGDMGLATDIVDKRRTDKALAEQLDKTLHGCGVPADAFMYYLAGNAASIQLFRSMLKARGVESRNIRTQPYWAAGKRGL